MDFKSSFVFIFFPPAARLCPGRLYLSPVIYSPEEVAAVQDPQVTRDFFFFFLPFPPHHHFPPPTFSRYLMFCLGVDL